MSHLLLELHIAEAAADQQEVSKLSISWFPVFLSSFLYITSDYSMYSRATRALHHCITVAVRLFSLQVLFLTSVPQSVSVFHNRHVSCPQCVRSFVAWRILFRKHVTFINMFLNNWLFLDVWSSNNWFCFIRRPHSEIFSASSHTMKENRKLSCRRCWSQNRSFISCWVIASINWLFVVVLFKRQDLVLGPWLLAVILLLMNWWLKESG